MIIADPENLLIRVLIPHNQSLICDSYQKMNRFIYLEDGIDRITFKILGEQLILCGLKEALTGCKQELIAILIDRYDFTNLACFFEFVSMIDLRTLDIKYLQVAFTTHQYELISHLQYFLCTHLSVNNFDFFEWSGEGISHLKYNKLLFSA